MKRPEWIPKWVNETFLLVVMPAIVVVLLITGFMIYGFQKPAWTSIESKTVLLDTQQETNAMLIDVAMSETYSVDQPYFIIDPYKMSPLSGLFIFKTDELDSFIIEVEGKTPEATVQYVSEVASVHYIPVIGLYPDYENVVHIYDNDDGVAGALRFTRTIWTEPVDEYVFAPDEVTTTTDYFGQDWMLLMPSDQETLPVAIDAFGDVRWYYSTPLGFSMKQLENGYFMVGSSRMIGSPYYRDGLYEIDLLGKVISHYYIPGGYHHDFVEMPSGNILALSNDFDETVEDIVVEIDRSTGMIVNQWDMSDYVSPTMGQRSNNSEVDWFHATSIDYDPVANRLLVAGRNQDIVLCIDLTSDELVYIIGDPTNWDEDVVTDDFLTPIGASFEWSYAIHSALFLPDGQVMLFDNGLHHSKDLLIDPLTYGNYSRGVVYAIDETTREITQVFSYGSERLSTFYSPFNSNVAYYGENHYLVHSGGISQTSQGYLNIPPSEYDGELSFTKSSITVEVQDDVVVYELQMPAHYDQALRIQPYDNIQHQSRLVKFYGEQQVSFLYEQDIDRRITILQTLPPTYELLIYKEFDRFVVSGVFEDNQEVYLELQQGEQSYYYAMPLSQSIRYPLYHQEVDGENLRTIVTVNEIDVSGRFDVFVIIDGHRYHTYKQVTFK
ncbi:aryl-sulfate sulfotransferase [Candidatus Xianfuyuplasma coldseepsis]|uniref:Aryl-sulfate sulfotransferase n=1 Tax=Candidatus Xianfuyuplasma coldseepsis TaxID=2782163 RepID=A0A7L7KRT4_9MOLU|nr:aryl-sulfate sulfotransferase [Xianfuyuplasma coldseepsis]QMS85531.1 aryl-sulfate sulfotransferase [Xianfuyuplasma coldseepsis]